MLRCVFRLVRFTYKKKLLTVLAAVALCAFFMSWRVTSESWEGNRTLLFVDMYSQDLDGAPGCRDVAREARGFLYCTSMLINTGASHGTKVGFSAQAPNTGASISINDSVSGTGHFEYIESHNGKSACVHNIRRISVICKSCM